MRTLVIVAALCACVCFADFVYTVPAAPCKWKVTMESTTNNSYVKRKMYVFGQYYASRSYNKHGDLISAYVVRADYAEFTKGATFSFNGLRCTVNYGNTPGRDYKSVLNFLSKTYDHIEETEYDGTSCMAYYNDNARGEPDINASALYVRSNGFPIALVTDADKEDLKTVTTFDFGTAVTMDDFKFSKGEVYACSDERIFHSPNAYYAQCSASTVGAVFAVVLAALVAALF